MRKSSKHEIPALIRGFAQSLANEQPNEEALVKAAAEACIRLLGAQQSSVWLIDADGSRLVLRAAVGYPGLRPEDVGVLNYPLPTKGEEAIGLTTWIYIHKVAVSADSFTEIKSKPGFRGRFAAELYGFDASTATLDIQHPGQQFYGGPIFLGDEMFGVLKVENKLPDREGNTSFSDREKEDLDAVAAILAMALKHARAGREAERQLQEYHRFTLHSIRNELPPLQAAKGLLKSLVQRHPSDDTSTKAARFLELGLQGLTFYLDNHLVFLRKEITADTIVKVPILELIQNEADLLREISQEEIEVTIAADGFERVEVEVNSAFLSAAIKELLRNARKAIFRRREFDYSIGRIQQKGIVSLYLSNQSPTKQIPADHFSITVADNGDATTNSRARESLAKAWAKVDNKDGQSMGRYRKARAGVQLGLEFIQSVAKGHNGYLVLDPITDPTSFCIHLPYQFIAKTGA